MMDRRRLQKSCTMLFQRTGATTSASGPIGSLPATLQRRLLTAANLVGDELPIIASAPNDQAWLLATTDRLIFQVSNEIVSIPVAQIREVHSAAMENANTGRDD